MYSKIQHDLRQELVEIHQAGLYKEERIIISPQSAGVAVVYPPESPAREVINFCANNYLGLSSHPEVLEAARAGLDSRGYGLSSVRFICGTQDIHKALEAKISRFLGMADTILYSSCFDANGGLFETLLKRQDAVISDELNHASIIDGIRLSKARRLIYRHNDTADLAARLPKGEARIRVQLSAAHEPEHIDYAIAAFTEIGRKYDVLGKRREQIIERYGL
jgi:glycine C-acetyltransferase